MLAGPGLKLSRFYRLHYYLDLQKTIYPTYVPFSSSLSWMDFYLCAWLDSLFFLWIPVFIHRGQKKHLSSTAKVCQGAERDPHSSARQSNSRTANRKPRKQTVSEGLVHQAVTRELLVTLLQMISQFVQFRIFSQSVWDKTKQKKRRLSGPENPTSTSHNW